MSCWAECRRAAKVINEIDEKIKSIESELESLKRDKDMWEEIYRDADIYCRDEAREWDNYYD